ncbi:MAG: hypothetical protein Q7U04_03935, partial [Bacteriovorax sp.]|nr:hypothetical protein [Bacteriovorax sp.]
VQVTALVLLKDYNENPKDIDELLSLIDSFNGMAKANALVKFSLTCSSANRVLLVNTLEKTFSSDDPNTVINVIEKLSSMNLSNEEYEKIFRSLCHFGENGQDDPNWKMIKYDLTKININIDKICTNLENSN